MSVCAELSSGVSEISVDSITTQSRSSSQSLTCEWWDGKIIESFIPLHRVYVEAEMLNWKTSCFNLWVQIVEFSGGRITSRNEAFLTSPQLKMTSFIFFRLYGKLVFNSSHFSRSSSIPILSLMFLLLSFCVYKLADLLITQHHHRIPFRIKNIYISTREKWNS